jgi:hypothetical protein
VVLAALALCASAVADTGSSGSSGTTGATGASSTTGPTGATGVTSPATVLLEPPVGDVFTGLSGPATSPGTFAAEVGKHAAVYGAFVTWGHRYDWAFSDASAAQARLMLHISTAFGNGPEMISPRGIADGAGDSYLLSLSATIARHGRPVYIRLMSEMNNANNPYSAFNADGSPRGASHSRAMFKAAWRRTVLIMRGGAASTINAKLAALKLPAVRGILSSATLPSPSIAFVWAPETAGTPNIPANSAAAYWPGSAYVDWVGTDFYSAFPNFTGLASFYANPKFAHKPFVFSEWAMWHNDSAAFVKQLFAFVNAHHRVQMMLYNQGFNPNGVFALKVFPAGRAQIKKELAASRFLAYTPEWQP